MYRVEEAEVIATFRLQLFVSADRLRPIAVVTQDEAEGGMSLISGRERFASQVWRDYFPGEPLPPVWVQRTVYSRHAELKDDDFWSGWELVTFDHGRGRHLTNGRLSRITQDQLDELVVGAVDTDRGREFPPPPPLTYRVHYVLVRMDQVPREVPWHEDCMKDSVADDVSITGRSDVADARDCCWYHSGDWAAVTRSAVRLIAQVEATGVKANYELRQQVLAAARAEGTSGWSLQALRSLLRDPILLRKVDGEHSVIIDGGQHRIRAMRDAGLAEVLIGNPAWYREDEL
jgi:hypothetical protein